MSAHLALLLVPLGIFFISMKKARSEHQRLAAACGVAIVLSYAIFGLTFTLFVRSQALCILAYLVAILIYFSIHDSASNEPKTE